jgi:hypothetical protein
MAVELWMWGVNHRCLGTKRSGKFWFREEWSREFGKLRNEEFTFIYRLPSRCIVGTVKYKHVALMGETGDT